MKKLKKIVLIGVSTVALLAIVLAVHIALVSKPVPNSSLQLSRIDFNAALNQENADEVVREIKQIDGVKFTHVNKEDGILVFSYDLNVTTGNEIYTQFAAVSNLPSERFVTTAENAMQGCPIKADDSFMGHFTSGIKSLLN